MILDSALLLSTFEHMLLARRLEEKITSIYFSGGIAGGVYTGRGQEAVSASLGIHLEPGDVFAPMIRDQAGRLAWGEDPLDMTRTYLGAVTGPMRGRDGNIHRGRPKNGMPAPISHLGAMISVVNGMLYARRMQEKPMGVGAASLGDGATSTGAFHEAVNLACVEKLPLVMLITNNQWAYSTPNHEQFACENLADRAIGYGATAHQCDGTDLIDCFTTMEKAVSQARDGGGPQLVVAELLRLCGHGEHDDATYIPESMRNGPLGQDCIERARTLLLENNHATPTDLDRLDAEVEVKATTAVATAQKDPAPEPYREDWKAFSSVPCS